MVATAESKGSIVQKPARSVFAVALLNQRSLFRYTRHDIADQCGVSVRDVEAWEKGEAVPDVQRYKRLVGMMRKLASTPPNYSRGTDRATLEDKIVVDIQREALKQKEPEKVPEPESFGAGLRRIRKENGLTTAELADIVGFSKSAVSNWEGDGGNAPAQANLEMIYEVLPELKAAIDVGSVKAPIISRQTSGHKPRHVAQPQLAIVKDETTKPEPVIFDPPPPAPSAPAAVLITKPGDPFADVANRYAAARRSMLLTQRKHAELQGQLADAKLAMEKAREEHDVALAAFDAIAAEPGQ